MGQKVHPLGFRLGITQNHQSQWYAGKKSYSTYILEDNFLRQYLLSKFSDAGIVNMYISRQMDIMKLHISAAQPRVFTTFGSQKNGSQSLEYIRQDLTQKLIAFRQKSDCTVKIDEKNFQSTLRLSIPEIDLYIEKLKSPFLSAPFIAQSIALELEKRVAFRKAMKSAVQRAQKAGVQGIKIQISGRLNGAEIARCEWVRKGRVPLHTLRAKVDYTCDTAKTIYGILGIKVWVFTGTI